MNWLITGGCGFIGSNLVSRLSLDPANNIRLFDNLTGAHSAAQVSLLPDADRADEPDSYPPNVSLIQGDVRDGVAIDEAMADIDVVVHLAASTGVGPSVEDPRHDLDVNAVGTFNCLEAARHRGVHRFVFASSSAPIGETTPPIHEEIAPHPASPYGASKLAGEGYCSAYWRSFGIETVALRFGNVYGPGSTHKSSVVAAFVKQALSDGTLEVHGDGSQTRDFIYVEDLVDAIYRAAHAGSVAGETFQIASNSETTINALAQRVRHHLAPHLASDVGIRYGPQRQGDVKRSFSETAKAQRHLGWVPQHTLEQGLAKTISFFLDQREARENR